MLQIVVVAGDVEVDLVLAKERIPVLDKDGVVPVDAVGVERVVADHNDERRGARLGELGAKPGVLLVAVLFGHGEPDAEEVVALGAGEVACPGR